MDLREYIKKLDKAGELARIKGASWDLEIGAIAEYSARHSGKAVLFDEIPDFPPNFRVLWSRQATPLQFQIATGMENNENSKDLREIAEGWRKKMDEIDPIPPVEVESGPIKQNIMQGEEVDLYKFPAPKWHELDGGRYIGTSGMNITKDPDTGYVNYGLHRGQILDKDEMTIYFMEGRDSTNIRNKYLEKDKPCPVAASMGQGPELTISSFMQLPFGESEYELAGGLLGEPVNVVRGVTTGLPVPAESEIVVEGEFLPDKTVEEGPFGEWPGYYGGWRKKEKQPVMKVKSIMYRNNPIILGKPPMKPPLGTLFSVINRARMLEKELKRMGIPGIRGVSVIPATCHYCTIVKIEQQYPGHARQIAHLVGNSKAHYIHKFIVIVDEDINIWNTEDVLWAISTRCDPAEDIEVWEREPSMALDPRLNPKRREKGNFISGKALIDACRPYEWKDEFPPTNVISDETMEKIKSKFKRQIGQLK
ncbi:hypothetical protein AKJ39_04900 [candidate division MSBL1 archaeon SCGC-AAA259J03]|uniref:UbiD family decarboxylase n=1 Tax=candidate division MSBL1 archaeon SCGC-AAA259J03 TaxID=1698269 RepID=A0A656YUP8_9EURY|nr:hypothetical protein AKJ39_04900 [candidate division MSBL1 archaeon SCGC-AAA259J03]